MKLWDQGFVDAEVVGYICFSEEGLVEFHFGNANGFMGCRGLKNKVITLLNFHGKGMTSWIQLSFGWGSIKLNEGKLLGHLFFQNVDESEFEAVLEL